MDLLVPDSGLLFWMLIAFGILFLVLAKYGWPVITGMASRRKERIETSLTEAAEARKLLATLKEQGDVLMEQARTDRAQMVAETAALRTQMITEARAAAAEESVKILEQARSQAEAERAAAMKELRSYVALLSVDVAETILRQQLTNGNSQTEMINRLIDEQLNQPKA